MRNRPANIQTKSLSQPSNSSLTGQKSTSQIPKEQQAPEPSGQQIVSSAKCLELMNIFRVPSITTKPYKETIEQICQSFNTMDSLTKHLEEKVDLMLKQQQQEFIESYKNHMIKVKEEFQQSDKQIEQYKKKIQYYENEGEMSHLVIKVNKLEEECRKLYKELANKDKLVKDGELMIKVQRQEIKRYEKEIKVLMKEKNELSYKVEEMNKYIRSIEESSKRNSISQNMNNDNDRSMQVRSISKEEQTQRQQIVNTINQLQSINSSQHLLFPTELQPASNNPKPHSLTNDQSHPELSLPLTYKQSQKSLNLVEPGSPNNSSREYHLKKQLSHLKKKNQLLTSFQSYVLDSHTSMQSFFVQCVNEIQQEIKIKKKLNYCTFAEWKKEDKIQLLIKIISNDDILAHLYERIFRKKRFFNTADSKLHHKDHTDGNQKSSIYEKSHEKSSISTLNINDKKLLQSHHNSILDRGKTIDPKKQLSNQPRVDLKNQKALSVAKRRFSKHISQNSLLPKIHFHLEY